MNTILLWIAQLLLDYIKSANNIKDEELAHQISRNKELESSIQSLKLLQEYYQASIDSVADNIEYHKKKLEDVKKEQKKAKKASQKALEDYQAELDAMSRDDVLRGKV